MIAITDLALFQKIGQILGFKGVFVPEDAAFRTSMEKHGDPQLPLYSLYWNSAGRDVMRYARPSAAHGVDVAWKGSGSSKQKVKYAPVDVMYDLHIWRADQIDLIDSLRKIWFFTTDPGGNGVSVTVDELGLKDVGIACTFDLNATMERSSSAEEGNFFHTIIPFIAHTFFVEGLEQRVIRKITADLYTYVENPVAGNDAVLQESFETRSAT